MKWTWGGQVAPGYSKADPWWIGGTNFLLNAFDRHVQTVAGALGEAEP